MTETRTLALINELLWLPAETEWAEFKENNTDPEMIGKRISAFANAARMLDLHYAYLLWGVRNENHAVVGTEFQPTTQRVGNQSVALQPFENSLTVVGPSTATTHAWTKLQPYAWETGIEQQFVTGDEVLERLDYVSYFDLTNQPLPDNRQGIFERLERDRLISNVNLGAILFAKDLRRFSPRLARKAVRFVAYGGNDRTVQVTHRQDGQMGYATGFKGLINYINGLLPRNEHIGDALRQEQPLFPSAAIRELVTNALIHQDMTVTGAGPLIELFVDRIEITNPGEPLVEPNRFIDSPPRSRNEELAAFMRRMGICEEQGTGIDKVIMSVELFQLPAPDFRVEGNATHVILYGPRSFAEMTAEERIRACYQHAVLRYVSGDRMKNQSLRERFGVAEQNASQVSQVFRQTSDRGLIRPADPDRPKSGYLPFWA